DSPVPSLRPPLHRVCRGSARPRASALNEACCRHLPSAATALRRSLQPLRDARTEDSRPRLSSVAKKGAEARTPCASSTHVDAQIKHRYRDVRCCFGALTAMTRLTHMIWEKREQVRGIRSSFAYLCPNGGHSEAYASPSLVDRGPPGT